MFFSRFSALCNENWSVNRAGDLISFTSMAHNKDILADYDAQKDWGNNKFEYFGLVFTQIDKNISISSARFYNFEFSNTACLTDGGTFAMKDGSPWSEGESVRRGPDMQV